MGSHSRMLLQGLPRSAIGRDRGFQSDRSPN
jgi:hypothetical protein